MDTLVFADVKQNAPTAGMDGVRSSFLLPKNGASYGDQASNSATASTAAAMESQASPTSPWLF